MSVAPIAQAQLEAWEAFASDWPVRYREREDSQQLFALCLDCGQAIYPVTDPHRKPFKYKSSETLAMMVGHLRQRHRDWEDIVYAKAGVI